MNSKADALHFVQRILYVLPWVVEILESMLAGRGRPDDLDQLAKLARFMGPGNTFCALAPGAAEPLQSALKYFRGDFEGYFWSKVIGGFFSS
jgi:NADH-quinone oxidoreductase subunit F